jgi:hypothetical protein
MTSNEDEDDTYICPHCCLIVDMEDAGNCCRDDTGFCIHCGRYIGGEG